MFFYVPKKLRAKLSRRWQLGTYLGLVNSSNEHVVATRLGNVVKSRSVVRVVEASRWNSDAALAVVGTPTLLNPLDPEDDAGYAAIDESEQPHLELDADIQDGNQWSNLILADLSLLPLGKSWPKTWSGMGTLMTVLDAATSSVVTSDLFEFTLTNARCASTLLGKRTMI